jgi:hypothetical protein
MPSTGQSIAVRAWMAWSTYSHKKAVLVVAFLLAWNMSSLSTRLWGGTYTYSHAPFGFLTGNLVVSASH